MSERQGGAGFELMRVVINLGGLAVGIGTIVLIIATIVTAVD